MITFTVETLGAVASTNDLLHERARAGADEGLVIRAEAQTAGRGRHGRSWVSPTGNLYASLLLRPLRPLDEAASLSLVIALSLAEALTQLGPQANLSPRLKWPNDVRLSGAKIAGILLGERRHGSGEARHRRRPRRQRRRKHRKACLTR